MFALAKLAFEFVLTISCCLSIFCRRWVANSNAVSGGIRALGEWSDCNNVRGYCQVGEMKGKDTRLFIMSRIRIPIRLCFLPIHSPSICMLGPIE